jgi:UDP-GlcNAc:undecaprenyl-phosphate GlcNAc-1-phosphate transferase
MWTVGRFPPPQPGAGIKLFFQIVGATLAFVGGISINGFIIGSYDIQFGVLGSYAVTVFWFVLYINAVNLIDELDGLAGGVVFYFDDHSVSHAW